MTAILLMTLVVTVGGSAAARFSCDSMSSHSCSCSGHSPTIFELICPGLSLQISRPESVKLQCIPDFSGFPTLSGLHIGDVEMFTLRFCPFPGTSIKELMKSIGIDKVKILQIQSYSNLSDTLQKKHFEKLHDVTGLYLNSNGLTQLPSDIFEDMGNLTLLDMKYNYIDFPKEIFYFTPKLQVLELAKNNLTHLKPGIFKNLESLRLLNLWGNKLENLTRAVFSDIPNLESLDLNSNEMESIRPDIFADLSKLKRLNLFANAFVSMPQGLLSRNTELEEFVLFENKRSLGSLPPEFFSNLPELKMVRLSGCKLMSLPENTFSGSIHIHTLFLDRNLLKTLKNAIFVDLQELELLDLSQNEITHLPEELFSKTKNLKTLKLHDNQLTEIPSRLFLQQRKLEYLDLRFNNIKEIQGEQFYNLESLKTLDISDNQLSSLADKWQLSEFGNYSVLKNCHSLEDLQLVNNSLSELYGDWKLLLRSLRTLNLAFNHFHSVQNDELDLLSGSSIDLSNNKIKFVNFRNAEFTAMNHVNSFNSSYDRDSRLKRRHVKLDNNPLNCDCLLLPFVQFVRNELSPEVQYLFDIPSDNLKCHEPKSLENMSLNYLPPKLLTCDYPKSHNYTCPEGCTCQYRAVDKGNLFNCQSANLREIPPALPQYVGAANHSELDLEGNQLLSFSLPVDKGYENVTHFYLSNNNITSFNATGISTEVKVLDLSNNLLTRLSPDVIEFLKKASMLERLELHGNPWQCDCDIKPLIRLIKNKYKSVMIHNVTCYDGTLFEELEDTKLCQK